MSRKITRDLVDAFYAGKAMSRDNTSVAEIDGFVYLILHGSRIARRHGHSVEIRDGGYRSNTTKERLNGVCRPLNVSIFQQNFEWFISRRSDDKPVSMPHGEWIEVSEVSPAQIINRRLAAAGGV